MKHLKKILSVMLALALILVPVSTAAASMVPNQDTNLAGYTVIMHTNDSHARAVPNPGSGYLGFTAVSALKKAYEAAGAQVILLDAGDTLHGLPFANLVRGESIVKIMNICGYDAMTPGNHDFNYGTFALTGIASNMDFALLSSNIMNKEDGSNFLKGNIIIEKNGVKYGVFGLSTPETAYKTNPKNVANIVFGNPIDAAKKEVAKLKADGAQVIIALAHLGVDKSSEFTSELLANQVDEIDLIVDGHSHSTFEEGLAVKDSLIVSTGEYIQNIGVVMINPNGTMKASLVNTADFTGIDPAVDERAALYSEVLDELLSEIIGETTVVLDGVRANVRSVETNLGDLAADAFLYATGADVAITNGGGIRASIEIGDITKKDIVTVFPFGNYVVTKKVTGEALLKALELGVSTYPEPLGAFLQVSGVTFSIDVSKPAGSRVADAKINQVPIDPKAEYLLATNDFVVAGGDGYTMLADFEVVNEFGSMEDVLADYIRRTGDVATLTQGRITLLETSEPVKEDTEDVEEIKEENTKEEDSEEETKESEEEMTEAVEIELPKTGEDASILSVLLIGFAALSAVMVAVLKKKERISR